MDSPVAPTKTERAPRDIHLPPRGPPLKDKYSITTVPHSTKDTPNQINIDTEFGDGDSKRWPQQDEDMTLLAPENDKHVLWRRTAGEWLAKDMGLYDARAGGCELSLDSIRVDCWPDSGTPARLARGSHSHPPHPHTAHRTRPRSQQRIYPISQFAVDLILDPIRSLDRESVSKLLYLNAAHGATHWILGNLPRQYGLFEQITHPKDVSKSGGPPPTQAQQKNNKLRLDRFVFGHNGRKIRSALSLGKHISWLLHGSIGTCTCDGCKIVSKNPHANASAAAAAAAAANANAGGAGASTSTASTATATTSTNAASASTAPRSNGIKNKKKRTVNVTASDNSGDERRAVAPTTAAAAVPVPPTKKVKGKARVVDGDDASSLMDEDEGSETYPPAGPKAAAAAARTKGVPTKSNGAAATSKALGTNAAPGGGGRRSSFVATNELESRADQFAHEMRAADPNRVAVVHSPWLVNKTADIDHPSWCRVGELVWAKTHEELAQLELLPPTDATRRRSNAPATPRFSHWPAIIRGRTVKPNPKSQSSPLVEYRIEFLALLDQPERAFSANEVVPWLGYIAAGLTSEEMSNAITMGGLEVAHSRQWTRDLVANGMHATRAAFLSAYMTGQFFASIQTRSLPTIETGSHLLPDPSQTNGQSSLSALRSMFMARPTTRFLSHAFVFYGPELIHVGDVVRLTSNVELPSSVEAQVIDHSPLQMPTSLVLHITKFARGGRDCPLLVRGKVYEMNEITLAADDGMPADYVSDDDIFGDDDATMDFENAINTNNGKELPIQINGNDGLNMTAAGAFSSMLLNGHQNEWARSNGLDFDSSSEDDSSSDDETTESSDTKTKANKRLMASKALKAASTANPVASTKGLSNGIGTGTLTPNTLHYRKKMPAPPFPAHRWRCLTPGREVDLLMTDLAGRYYPVSPSIYADDTLVNRIAESAARTGVVGEVGIAPLALLLGGLMSGDKVPRVNARNGLLGDDRERQLSVAEEQAYIAAGLKAVVGKHAQNGGASADSMDVDEPPPGSDMKSLQTTVVV
ncbi:BQ2448_6829 [Microbotryum intermedium]|uniref:BQ2448_6829 protein n=1 Tax=Microbotryum intermedium TaxID=269621 RepID=A0A238FM94_9BASI|nr:BQ2448_6829 [Microbotryum intermedium]